MGLEPTTPGTTIRCSNQLSYTHHIFIAMKHLTSTGERLVRQKGLEPLAYCLEGSCSIRLSYWRGFSGTSEISEHPLKLSRKSSEANRG